MSEVKLTKRQWEVLDWCARGEFDPRKFSRGNRVVWLHLRRLNLVTATVPAGPWRITDAGRKALAERGEGAGVGR